MGFEESEEGWSPKHRSAYARIAAGPTPTVHMHPERDLHCRSPFGTQCASMASYVEHPEGVLTRPSAAGCTSIQWQNGARVFTIKLHCADVDTSTRIKLEPYSIWIWLTAVIQMGALALSG